MADAYGMLRTALTSPDPVIIFEHVGLYNASTDLDELVPTAISGAAIRRNGTDATLITYGGSLPKVLDAAEQLAQTGIDCEVVDLRVLRPLDDATILESVRRTHRAVIVDEGWRTGSLAAEVSARIVEGRSTTSTRPSDASAPSRCRSRTPNISRRRCRSPTRSWPRCAPVRGYRNGRSSDRGWAQHEFTMPALGADMDEGTLNEWMVQPGDTVTRGQIVAVVETTKAAVEIECWHDGVIGELLVPIGQTVAVGTALATILEPGEKAEPRPAAAARGRNRGRD